MNQVSRPMQIMLIGVLVFAALWMTVLKPKDEAAEPAAATPVATSPVAAGGEAATSGAGKAVEAANNAAKTSDAANAQQQAQTGDDAPAATTPATTSSSAAGTTPAPGSADAVAAAKAKVAKAKAKAAAKAKAKSKSKAARNAAERAADQVTERVAKDLASRHAVVVLVAGTTGSEDKILRKRVKDDIDRRKGRVKVYVISASKVGDYDGLLGSLNIAQTPSTIVIAPNNQAKVLGGLTSTARIDRLTSAALLVKPETKTK